MNVNGTLKMYIVYSNTVILLYYVHTFNRPGTIKKAQYIYGKFAIMCWADNNGKDRVLP